MTTQPDLPGLAEGIEAACLGLSEAGQDIADWAVRAAYEPIAKAVREQTLKDVTDHLLTTSHSSAMFDLVENMLETLAESRDD